MDAKTTTEKLQILLPHWIEHNNNHEVEFRKWAASARAEGAERLAKLLEQATASMATTDEILKKALIEAGGAAPDPHHHHHNHHHN